MKKGQVVEREWSCSTYRSVGCDGDWRIWSATATEPEKREREREREHESDESSEGQIICSQMQIRVNEE
jgi:hypothetical protein